MFKKENEIGALWKKNGQYGTFLSGHIEINGQKIEIICFPNQYKKEDKHPSLRIFLAQKQSNFSQKTAEIEQNQEDLKNIPF